MPAAAKALARSARAVARRAASRIQAQHSLFAKPVGSVSSTAKTQDLGGKSGAAAQMPSVPQPKGVSVAKSTDSKNVIASAAKIVAGISPASRNGSVIVDFDRGSGFDPRVSAAVWLVAAGSALRFGLVQSRTVIGRARDGQDAPDVDLGMLKSGGERVSRRHAEIIKHGPDYYIRDLGSLNGTYITGRGRLGREQLYRLRDCDQIVCGSAKLEFRKS
jgi:FHA domain